jgi:hypothetical protein
MIVHRHPLFRNPVRRPSISPSATEALVLVVDGQLGLQGDNVSLDIAAKAL